MAESNHGSAQRFATPDARTMCDYETLAGSNVRDCRLKFFTPRELARPAQAEKYLQQKFISHECKDRVQPMREV